MVTYLVVYGTGEGQTAKVAARIADVISARGHDVTLTDVDDGSEPLSEYGAVVVGSSIHVGKHHEGVRSFLEENGGTLEGRPTAFFQLSLSSAVDDPDRRAEAAGYVDSLLESTGWHPDRIALFGGALRYSKYGFLKRLIMKRIARDATGDVDTSRDYEYTDWEEVETFAADFAAFVDGRLGTDASPTSETAPEE